MIRYTAFLWLLGACTIRDHYTYPPDATLDEPDAAMGCGACEGVTPICDQDMCRGCESNDECESMVCDPSGACLDATSVVYVSMTGQDIAPCPQEAPCRTPEFGWSQLDATRTTMYLFAGDYAVTTALVVSAMRSIIGAANGDSRLSSSDPTDLAVDVQAGGTLSLRDLTLTETVGCVGGQLDVERLRSVTTGGTGLVVANSCTSVVADSSFTCFASLLYTRAIVVTDAALTVERSTFAGCNRRDAGVLGQQSVVTIIDSELIDTGIGVSATDGDVTIERSLFHANGNGGIRLDGGRVSIINNVVHHNGDDNNVGGGIVADGVLSGSRIEFNTVAYNRSGSMTPVRAGGIHCDGAAPNNLVYNNFYMGSNTVVGAQTTGTSTFAGSLVVNGNGTNEIGFVSPTAEPYDFHIADPSSPAIGIGQPSSIVVDIDGETRPHQGASDVGADEYYP